MTTPTTKRLIAAVVVAVALGGGCSRPAPNDAVRITGDRTDAVPVTEATTTTSTIVAPSTSSFYGPGGPGDTAGG